MSQGSSLLRRIVIWTGPIAAMAVLVVGGFLYWVLGTTSGGRWALVTVTMQFDGSVSGVSGSVWHGLKVSHLELPTGTLTVELRDLDLRVQWPSLLERELHIQNLSADQLHLALTQDDQLQEESEPFRMPELPVQIRVDRLAVDQFSMRINNDVVPVTVSDLAASVSLNAGQGQLRLNSLALGHDHADVQLNADVQILNLNEPWPFDVEVLANVQGRGEDSVLCARRYLPTLPQDADLLESCSADVHVTARGDLESLVLTAGASGQGMELDAELNLTPLAGFPLKDGRIDLTLADQSSLNLDVDWVPGDMVEESGVLVTQDTVRGSLRATQLNVGQLAGDALPSAILTAAGHFEAQLRNRSELVSSRVELEFGEGSIWNDLPLAGLLKAHVEDTADIASEAVTPLWEVWQIHDLDIDVTLGGNHVLATGRFGGSDSDLAVQLRAPELAAFWPGLPGGIDLDAQLSGTIADHALALDATYTPADSQPDTIGLAPAQVNLDVAGGWGPVGPAEADTTTLQGWTGQIRALDAGHAGLGLSVTQVPSLRLVPGAPAADGLWRLGGANIALSLDDRPVLQLEHESSSGGSGGQWATAGAISQLTITQALIDDIQEIIGRAPGVDEETEPDRGGVKIRDASNQVTNFALALDWNLRFDQALAGSLNVRHLSGDVMVPAQPPFALGLQTLSLAVTADPLGGGRSQLGADLTVATEDMGRISARVVAGMQATAGGGFALDTEGATVDVDAAIDDLGWVSLFVGDAMEFGGQINANVRLVSGAQGWDSSGTITGDNVRIVRIDDGVRLLDGTLLARLEGDRIILDKLEFPARLRVEPKEWRTAEWISTNPDARDGYLRLSGDWRLSDTAGDVDIELYRYPILQRADRYAMVTGTLHVGAELPALSITGSVEADAGWIDLDMLGGIPTVDGDVVIIRGGEDQAEVNVPMDISMDIEVDLGPRVYLTGYGVNSGLVGNMRIMMVDNKLTAIGALRTRGGAIEAYGQRLQLRRGTITFQGDIASPILSIEALRTGQPIEAGVRVSGTARRPAIDLVSYPDVSDIEKLSWLLFGHGPDESGGDMALLLSVGTSFLGDGEPFYRKFGIDELSLQSGDIGSAGSILPAESVVSGLNSGASDLERQFISASKGVANGLTVSVRQALSDAGTVGRVSYRLARGLTAELSVGTVNGLALVYRWFSRD